MNIRPLLKWLKCLPVCLFLKVINDKLRVFVENQNGLVRISNSLVKLPKVCHVASAQQRNLIFLHYITGHC